MAQLIENLKNLLVPQGKVFFEYLSSVAKNNCKMAEHLTELCTLSLREERISLAIEIEKIEEENDGITHSIFTQLGKIFLTPIPREDIHTMAGSLDDVADYIFSISRHMYIISPGINDNLIIEFARLIEESTILISDMVVYMGGKSPELAFELIEKVKKLAAASADLYEKALESLYHTENDFKLFIRLREIFMVMNETMNKCHNVAYTVENIMLAQIN